MVQEMIRVSRKAVVIISSGTPEKRIPYLTEFIETSPSAGKVTIEDYKLEISNLANLINILRTEMKDRPLSHALLDREVLKQALIATF